MMKEDEIAQIIKKMNSEVITEFCKKPFKVYDVKITRRCLLKFFKQALYAFEEDGEFKPSHMKFKTLITMTQGVVRVIFDLITLSLKIKGKGKPVYMDPEL